MSGPTPIAIERHRLKYDGPEVGLPSSRHSRYKLKNNGGIFDPFAPDHPTLGKWRPSGWHHNGTILVPEEAAIEERSDPLPGWVGQSECKYQVRNRAVQVTAHEPDAEPLITMRRTDDPQAWINVQVVGGDSSGHVVYPAHKAIQYPEAIPGAKLWWQVREEGIGQVFEEHTPGSAPVSWRLKFKMPAAVVIDRQGDVFYLRDQQGRLRMTIRAPHGWDEGTEGLGDRYGSAPGATSTMIPIAVDVIDTWVEDGYRYAIVEYTPDAAARAAATGKCFFDPTVIGPGGSVLSDSILHNYSPFFNNNFGGRNSVELLWNTSGVASVWSIFSIEAAQIPSGTVTSAVWHYWLAAGHVWSGMTIENWPMKNAVTFDNTNEGTGNNHLQVGMSCPNYQKYNSEVWPGGIRTMLDGSAGSACLHATNGWSIYEPTNPTTYTKRELAFDLTAAQNWADGTWTTPGWRSERQAKSGSGANYAYMSQENGAGKAWWAVFDVMTGPSFRPHLMARRR